MAVEDYLEPEVGIAVAVTAAVTSPKVRSVLRRGAVYGLAGVLKVGDALSAAAGGVRRGMQNAASEARAEAEGGPAETSSLIVPPGTVTDTPEAGHKRTRKTSEAENG